MGRDFADCITEYSSVKVSNVIAKSVKIRQVLRFAPKVDKLYAPLSRSYDKEISTNQIHTESLLNL